MVFVYWLKARIQERIYFRLINTNKVPYTKAGLNLIESEIRVVLAEGVANGGLAASPAPTVTVPNPLTVDPNLRAQRILEGVRFEARLAGAVQKVVLYGVVTV